MPKSIFIHEQQPSLAQLIGQGMRLWQEEVELRPGKNLERLWLMASELMNKELHRQRSAAFQRFVDEHKDELAGISSASAKSPEMMSANIAKLLIVGGSLVPKTWDSQEPYPYQGLFISAFYFLEANNQLEDANTENAWVLLTQAYYYLGMNSSTLSAHESAVDAATSRHVNNSKAIRKVIVTILDALCGDTSITSGAKAIERVVKEIENNPGYKAVLNDYNVKCEGTGARDKNSPKKELQPAADRLKDRLVEWSSPSSKYPDVAVAFAPFKRGKRAVGSKKERPF